ncbi:hypothetical protein SAMN05192534_108128 [Alteribacillus persepolensis]|uniref:Pyrroline-5-carboxylate reductase catalytic N-terminal domain-containing protein n=1 Tax=Alteribacillus persepolensis TaxID=568899 RepID=A0A1G8E3K6_9BACI|nr:hypothetical protein [Alteribacillus persepolensis]SDH64488.1 hypothetical protein SAMN05192534_108128 [Alteribacillus persepolensis]
MLMIGFGKLSQMVVSLNQSQSQLHVYNRTKENVEAASLRDSRIQYCPPSSFSAFSELFLALPPQGCVDFLEEHGKCFPKGAIVFHTATNLSKEDIERAASHLRVVPAKFAGHAAQAVRDKSGGTFVVPAAFSTERKLLKTWLGDAFAVVEGKEDAVKTANQIAVEETLKAAVRIEQRLEENGISSNVQRAVLAQIPAGVMHAHIEGAHGGFAKRVLQEMAEVKGGKST